MSGDFLGPDDPDSDYREYSDSDNGSRRRAAWSLTVLALGAIVVVALITIFVGTSPKKNQTVAGQGETGSSAATSPGSSTGAGSSTSATPSTSGSTSTSASASPSTSSSPTAAPGSKKCPTSAPCVIPGDDGGAVAAVNALRTAKGLPAVPGSVTPNAQQCALDQGNGPTCVPHYAWQPLSAQDGKACAAAVSSSWVLDPSMKTLMVGWALSGGQWQCALLKAP